MGLEKKIILTAREEKALAIFKGHRALIQTVADKRENEGGDRVIDYREIDELLDQLYDPNQYRQSRSGKCFEIAGIPRPSTLQKTNLKTKEVTTIEAGQCRFTKHKDVEFRHTAKMSTSLLPTEPQYMTPFGGGSFIGFGWDIDTCDVKDERYVWEEDAGTDCQWLSPYPNPHDDPNGIDEHFWALPLSSISGLRAKNDKAVAAKTVIEWNELLVGLPKRRVDFIFINQDTPDFRSRASDVMQRTKARLKLDDDIPIIIITNEGVRVYTAAEREKEVNPSDVQMSKQVKVTSALSDCASSLFADNRFSMKNYLIKEIDKSIDVYNNEINSWWPYLHLDRKCIKIEALNRIKRAILNDGDVAACISDVEKKYPEALEGILSTRTKDLIGKINRWATRNQSSESCQMKTCPAA